MSFTGGVIAITADVLGDGTDDLILTPGNGGGGVVVIYDGIKLTASSSEQAEMQRFLGIEDPSFRGGASVVVGFFNGDRRADLVVVAGAGGGPRVAIFDGTTMSIAPTRLIPDFFAFEPSLRTGLTVAVGDITGDGVPDIAFGAGVGGAPRVRITDGASLLKSGFFVPVGQETSVANFYAAESGNRNGVSVSFEDVTGDEQLEFVTRELVASAPRNVYFLRTLHANLAPLPDIVLDAEALPATNGVFVD